jgi:hypothetical protein
MVFDLKNPKGTILPILLALTIFISICEHPQMDFIRSLHQGLMSLRPISKGFKAVLS